MVARGQGHIYLRIPTLEHYKEKIWDHAAGCIIAEEAGLVVSDIHGNKLDFNCGEELKKMQVSFVLRVFTIAQLLVL